jgi:hypothetical protein
MEGLGSRETRPDSPGEERPPVLLIVVQQQALDALDALPVREREDVKPRCMDISASATCAAIAAQPGRLKKGEAEEL